ncbi:MAG: SPFH domain-containing protein [Gloeotrichia echinulata DVL01]
MLFWLTFIQSLPISPVAEISQIQLEPKTNQTTLISQTLPVRVQPTIAQINSGVVFPGVIAGLVLLLLLSLFAYTRVYVVTPNNEAFVRTGGLFIKQKSVILYGGCIVIPGFHQLTRVPLREISIDVERTGKLAVRTKDYLRADIRVTFYVCINASEEDVLTAAARLSQNGKITPEDIKNALDKRADDAIRAAAKTKDLAEIDSDKLGFAQEVLNLVEPDLKKVGLTLNNIAISEILESLTYDPENFFDAQGVRLRTEIIQRSIQQKREVELATQVAIEQKELDAQKRSLQITQEQESAKLEQKLQVEALKAQREREIQESKDREAATVRRTKILQEKAVEEEEIRKKLAVQQSQIEADIALEERNKVLKVAQALQKQEAEIAEITRQQTVESGKLQAQVQIVERKLAVQQSQIEADIALEERNKLLKVAQALQKQEAEIAEITRQQTVESGKLQAQVQIVESERLARLAQEDVAIAISNKKRESFLAQAEQAKAEESVRTAGEVEKAERTKRLSLIAAEREAQERSISDRNVVEIDAFRRRPSSRNCPTSRRTRSRSHSHPRRS